MAKNLTKEQILEAFSETNSLAAAARFLDVSYNTFKKSALFLCPEEFKNNKNESGQGVRRGPFLQSKLVRDIRHNRIDPEKGISKNADITRLKRRLITDLILEEKCVRCGFSETRIHDHLSPLLIDFLDGNKKNFNLNNIRLICYNCFFLINGVPWGNKRKYKEDMINPLTGEISDDLVFREKAKRIDQIDNIDFSDIDM